MFKHFYETEYDYKYDKKMISKLFLSLTFSMLISYFVLTLVILITKFFPNLPASVSLIINDFYTIIVTILFCFFSKSILPRRPIAVEKMTPVKFFMFVCLSVPLMLIGAFIGNMFSSLASFIVGHDITNSIKTLGEDYPPALVFVSVIIVAPIFEELMFRKLLIDKISRFGFGFSVVVSGFVFGTFHGNFYQFFYGCLLGFVLAFIYCMYAKLRYCILLHSIINFKGFVGPMYLGSFLSSPNFTLNFLAMCYALAYYLLIPLGLVIIVFGIKKIKTEYSSFFDLSKTNLIHNSLGFAIYLVVSIIIFILSLFA